MLISKDSSTLIAVRTGSEKNKVRLLVWHRYPGMQVLRKREVDIIFQSVGEFNTNLTWRI